MANCHSNIIATYFAYIYQTIINSMIHVERLNKVVEKMNDLIFKRIEINNSEQEANFTKLIEDCNKGLIQESQYAMAFVNIAMNKIYEIGKLKFNSAFPFKEANYDNYNNSKYIGELPNGFQHLLQKPDKISLARQIKRILVIIFF